MKCCATIFLIKRALGDAFPRNRRLTPSKISSARQGAALLGPRVHQTCPKISPRLQRQFGGPFHSELCDNKVDDGFFYLIQPPVPFTLFKWLVVMGSFVFSLIREGLPSDRPGHCPFGRAGHRCWRAPAAIQFHRYYCKIGRKMSVWRNVHSFSFGLAIQLKQSLLTP